MTTPTPPFSLCVYCGSRHGARASYTQAARVLGQAIGSRGWQLVYGGGKVGLMGVVADAVEVAALVGDAVGAGRAMNGFRAVYEIETEDVFFAGGGDAEAVTVVGAAADEAAVVELFPCVRRSHGWESMGGCAAIEVSERERALQANGADGEEREEQEPTGGADGGGEGTEAAHEVVFPKKVPATPEAANREMRWRPCKYGGKLKKGFTSMEPSRNGLASFTRLNHEIQLPRSSRRCRTLRSQFGSSGCRVRRPLEHFRALPGARHLHQSGRVGWESIPWWRAESCEFQSGGCAFGH
jgi:hypothetical protein